MQSIVQIAPSFIAENYTLQTVSDAHYWKLYQEHFYKEDNPSTFINIESMYNDRYGAPASNIICLWLLDKGEVIAIFRGIERSAYHFEMNHCVVHRAHRQKGVYSAIVDMVIDYCRAQKYAEIMSSHAPNNNAILIAKLKKGFHFISMELDPRFGVNVNLRYFLDEDAKQAYLLRCNSAVLNENLNHYSSGSFLALKNSIQNEAC